LLLDLGWYETLRGRLTQSGGGNSPMALTLGDLAGTEGSYELAGGLLDPSGTVIVGRAGTGTFDHTAGRVDRLWMGELYVGAETGGAGAYDLMDSAALAIGYEIVGVGGYREFQQIGGTFLLASDQAVLVTDLAPSGISLIEVTDTSSLDGVWNVLDGAVASGRYDVLRAVGGIDGAFEEILLPGPDWRWGIEGGTTLYVEYVPHPAMLSLLPLVGLAITRWRNK
jgi:hypothetical protein